VAEALISYVLQSHISMPEVGIENFSYTHVLSCWRTKNKLQAIVYNDYGLEHRFRLLGTFCVNLES